MSFDETSDGAAYLSSLKRSGSPQAAATAAARAPELPQSTKVVADGVATTSAASAARPENRRSPRYKCKGSARVQGCGGAVSNWATLADISVHGCYIETPAPCRVGDFLGLRLEANGFQVEATGEVRAAYPGLGMGIFFTRMSEADRGRLRELVKSISHASVILGGARTPSMPKPDTLRAVTNPDAVLQAMLNFFEERHVMGREEFLKLLRNSQSAGMQR